MFLRIGKSNKVLLFIMATAITLFSCGPKKTFTVEKSSNPEYVPDQAFVGYEDYNSARFKALKEKYQLDTIFHGETDEQKRISLLRNWVSKIIKINNDGPYPGDGSVESILDEALKGHGFHCGHYTAVQNAVMNAYGYVTRCLIIDIGTPVDFIPGGGHHAVNEVWSNKYHKWFVSDAKYDFQFEKNGIPLSALEVRDEYFKNKAADITSKLPGDRYPELKSLSMEQFAMMYTWLSWGKYNNRFTNSHIDTDSMIVYADEYFRTHTWLWDGKPHWAYKSGHMCPVKDRQDLEWTPNTITSNVVINDDVAKISLTSNTPNLQTYQLKELPSGEWKSVSDKVNIKLEKDRNEFVFRTQNLAGVTGPEHRVLIQAGAHKKNI